LRSRFDAAALRGDKLHQQEEARFNLYLIGDKAKALALAQENWTLQREPRDARILLEAALAMKDPAAAPGALQWLRDAGHEGPRRDREEAQGAKAMRAAGKVLIAAALALASASAFAHKPSDSYLAISVEGTDIKGQWDIALRDLDFAIGIDDNGDGDITWGEVK